MSDKIRMAIWQRAGVSRANTRWWHKFCEIVDGVVNNAMLEQTNGQPIFPSGQTAVNRRTGREYEIIDDLGFEAFERRNFVDFRNTVDEFQWRVQSSIRRELA